jgi:hypothetical protein
LRNLRFTLVVLLAIALAPTVAACGKKSSGGADGSGRNFEVREAVSGALDSDAAIDESALGIIGRTKAGSEPLQQGLDELVDQTDSLIAVISSVTAPAKPPDARLASAQKLMSEYLRNRVHQIELAMSATSPAELESLYNQAKSELEAQRKQVVDLLLSYDPGLKKFIE